ncbi:MAG: hypothetical protein ABSC50_06685 [Candidatus Bathyarchaeia archaeon]
MTSWRPFKMLVCFLLGHNDSPVKMTLGKLIPQEIEAQKCTRCSRILVPISKAGAGVGEDAA